MEISWLGHSCFRLRGNDASLVTDPYAETVGFPLPPTSASVVAVSNAHPHHSNWQVVEGSPRVLVGPGEYEISGIIAQGIRTVSVSEAGEELPNTVYLFEMDGLTLCHLGDLARPLTAAQVEALSETQVLFVPAGGGCTLSVAQVAEVISQIEPRVVIPMHYGAPEVAVNLGTLEAFVRELGVSQPQPQARLVVSPSNLPQEAQVVVLERLL